MPIWNHVGKKTLFLYLCYVVQNGFEVDVGQPTDYDYTKSDEDIENEYIDKLIELIPELNTMKARYTWKDNWTNFDIREFLLSTEKQLTDKYDDLI